MNRNGNPLRFTTIGENIHTTRVLLRKGKRIVRNPDGVESVLYRNSEGETRYLPIPEAVKRTQDYQEGRVKHVKIAVLAAQAGGPESEEGLRYLRYLVDRQLSAGVDFLDLNVDEVSLKLNEQKEAMQWLVGTVQAMSPVPVSVDSSNIEIIQAGLEACHDESGRNLLNSASLERLEALDLAREHDTKVIVTAAGEKGMPQNETERLENASRMVEAALARGIPLASIYVDVLVFPISVDGQFGHHALETIRQLRSRYGSEVHITGGLSNVSFGLPRRRLINDVFILLSLEAGADSGIIDPVASNLQSILSMDRQANTYRMTEDLLLGRDRHCKNFLRAYRKGELQ
ncbi:MAG: dihydropteroate synthase [Acidobacteriota bacterium]|nr:dihydropteroate synthase [Acidobacteriota bacterium]